MEAPAVPTPPPMPTTPMEAILLIMGGLLSVTVGVVALRALTKKAPPSPKNGVAPRSHQPVTESPAEGAAAY